MSECINCGQEISRGERRIRLGRYELCEGCKTGDFSLHYTDKAGFILPLGSQRERVGIYLKGFFVAWAYRMAKRRLFEWTGKHEEKR